MSRIINLEFFPRLLLRPWFSLWNLMSPLTNFIQIFQRIGWVENWFQVIPKLIKFSIWSDSRIVSLDGISEYFKVTFIIILFALITISFKASVSHALKMGVLSRTRSAGLSSLRTSLKTDSFTLKWQ